MFPTRAAIASNYRRLQRFFEQVILDGSQLARVIVRIAGVGSGPWLLALDRTCWTFGRYDINIRMLAIIHNGIAIPVMWDVLGRAGTSTTAQRSALLSDALSSNTRLHPALLSALTWVVVAGPPTRDAAQRAEAFRSRPGEALNVCGNKEAIDGEPDEEVLARIVDAAGQGIPSKALAGSATGG